MRLLQKYQRKIQKLEFHFRLEDQKWGACVKGRDADGYLYLTGDDLEKTLIGVLMMKFENASYLKSLKAEMETLDDLL